MSQLPDSVIHGLAVAAGMLGAVGMAVLMKMLVSTENIGWLFVGFVLAKYLNLPAIVIAIIAVVIAITIGLTDKKIHDLKQMMTEGTPMALTEEEEFFNE